MILDVIVEDKKKRLIQAKERVPLEQMKELAVNCEREAVSFYEAIKKPGLSIIGEFKKASPSHGKMNNKVELTDRIDQYNASVDAISCLTEEDHFLGSVDYFMEIRKISPLPMLRKDFTIDLHITEKLSKMVPEEVVFVSESGVVKDEDIAFLKGCVVDGLLIGTVFMEAQKPGELADKWKRIFLQH